MKDRLIETYLNVAQAFSHLSYAKRLKVGCIVVKDDRIISVGYNGTPAGWDNSCEDVAEDGSLKTKECVLHAEMNCLMKLAKSHESGKDGIMFLTHSPCKECSKGIYQAGITKIYFRDLYRPENSGLEFLKQAGIQCIQKESVSQN